MPIPGAIITIDLGVQVKMCRCGHRTQVCQKMIALTRRHPFL